MFIEMKKFFRSLSTVKPTFEPPLRPSRRPLRYRGTTVQTPVSGDLERAFDAYDVRAAWESYKSLSTSHPEDHSRMLSLCTVHTHPPIAAAHAARITYNMDQAGIKLDPRDYHSLLWIHVANKDLQRAHEVYSKMLQDYPPDSRSTCLLLSLYGHFSDVAGVLESWNVVKNIPGALRNPDVWAVGIEAFGKSGMFDQSLDLFEQYLQSCKSRNEMTDRKPFEAMIRVYGKRGKLTDAKSLFAQLHTQDLESFDAIIEACEYGNDFEVALDHWNQLLVFCKRPGSIPTHPLPKTIARMMGFYSRQKNLPLVLDLYEMLRQRTLPEKEHLEHIVWTCLWTKEEKEAIGWYDDMVGRGYMPSVLLVNTMEHVKDQQPL